MEGYPIGGDVFHIDEFTAPLLTQLHQGAVIDIRGIDFELHIGLFYGFTLLRVGQGGWIVHHHDGVIKHVHLIDHRWRGNDQIKVVFPLQPLLHDFHVQQAEEATTETKAHGAAGFGLIFERGIRELQLV